MANWSSTVANVELPFLVAFAFFEDADVVGPADFSHKLCEIFTVPVSLIKVLHSPQVGGRESVRSRKFFAQVPGEIADNCLPPSISLLSLHDHPANIQVESNLFSIDRAQCVKLG